MLNYYMWYVRYCGRMVDSSVGICFEEDLKGQEGLVRKMNVEYRSGLGSAGG